MDYPYRRQHFMDDTVYRSSPTSLRSYSVHARDLRSPRTMSPYDYEESFATDYFNFSPDSPYGAYYPYFNDRRDGYYDNSELVRRSNLESAMANSSILRPSRYALIHPMMCADGGYPTEFNTPRPLEEFLEMGEGQLERIMIAYELASAGSWHDRDLMSIRYGYGYNHPRRISRLVVLFEYLGAYRLAEQLRLRRPGLPLGLPRYGISLMGY